MRLLRSITLAKAASYRYYFDVVSGIALSPRLLMMILPAFLKYVAIYAMAYIYNGELHLGEASYNASHDEHLIPRSLLTSTGVEEEPCRDFRMRLRFPLICSPFRTCHISASLRLFQQHMSVYFYEREFNGSILDYLRLAHTAAWLITPTLKFQRHAHATYHERVRSASRAAYY